jgi:putative methionine-R-sulfoxide reductase with GAF domain
MFDYSPMTTTQTKPTDLIPALDSLSISCNSADTLMKAIVALLHEKLTRYNWVGFYMLEKDGDRDVLVLGSFKGAMTPHYPHPSEPRHLRRRRFHGKDRRRRRR